jgi:hypothetical protein
MPGIGNKNEATFTDGSGPTGDICNMNTASKRIEVPNGATIRFFSDAYTTLGGQIVNGNPVPATSGASGTALASSGTIATTVGVSKVAPTATVTAVVMAPGTIDGQYCVLINEAAPSNSVQMAASGTSNVFNGAGCIIPGQSQNLFVWDQGLAAGSGLWVEAPALVDGKLNDIPSATAPATASSGTIATAGIGTSQVAPTAAVTACVLAAGIYPGQEVNVVNEAVGTFTITFAASATSNVAQGTGAVISGLTCAKYKWVNSLWYHVQ